MMSQFCQQLTGESQWQQSVEYEADVEGTAQNVDETWPTENAESGSPLPTTEAESSPEDQSQAPSGIGRFV